MANEFDEKDLKNALTAWRKSADKQAERPEWFWARQRARIESRMNERKIKHFPSLAWAGIAATLAIGAALMVSNPAGEPVAPRPTPTEARVQMSDHELMLKLESTMNSGVPESLQPASALAQEMEQAYSAGKTSNAKESRQ